jgi:hypothetical protein
MLIVVVLTVVQLRRAAEVRATVFLETCYVQVHLVTELGRKVRLVGLGGLLACVVALALLIYLLEGCLAGF